MRRQPVLAAVALLVSLGVVACSTSAPPFVEQPISASVQAFYTQKLHWIPCADGKQCTTLRAPLDWQHPASASISLALVRQRATGVKQGSLLMNPGGPGESGVSFIKDDINDAVDASLQEHFDIVGFDPRGVGESTPVTCYSDRQLDAYLYAIVPGKIGSTAWIDTQTAHAQAFAAACKKNTGPLLGHIDTLSAAHDLERALLGESKLTYLGYSYGSYLGTLYAGLYPHRVGRMVLDGAEDPWTGANNGTTDTSQEEAFEGDLRAYLAACLAGKTRAVAHDRCAFSGSVASALTAISALLTSVNAHPIRNSDGRMLGSATLAGAIFNDLYDPSQWPDLNGLFLHVQRGEPGAAFDSSDSYNNRSADGSYANNEFEANTAIQCLEGGGDSTRSSMRADAAALEKAAPVLGIYDAYSAILCAAWPYGPVAFPAVVHAAGAPPILVIGTTGDPATPYAQAVALAKQLDSGVLVTFRGEGHTAYDKGISCIDSTVDRYFISGTVPRADPLCN